MRKSAFYTAITTKMLNWLQFVLKTYALIFNELHCFYSVSHIL